MSDLTDWELVARSRSGDMDAFGQLVLRYQRPLVHFCYRMIGSQQDAQDIAQECFLRLYRYVHRLTPDAKFSTVLFGMARNLTLNFLRDSARRGRGRTLSMTRDDDSEVVFEDLGQRPDEAARHREIEALLVRALDDLSPEHKEILVLRELQGLDYESIASILQCQKGTVKSRLARARDQLRLRFIERGGELL